MYPSQSNEEVGFEIMQDLNLLLEIRFSYLTGWCRECVTFEVILICHVATRVFVLLTI